MTTATIAPEGKYTTRTPFAERDTATTLSQYRDREAIVGGVLWDLLAHDPVHGARMAELVNMPIPETIANAGEDMWQILWELVSETAEYGYRLGAGRLVDAFDPEKATTADLARAFAAVLGRRTVEDAEPYDPEEPVSTRLNVEKDAA